MAYDALSAYVRTTECPVLRPRMVLPGGMAQNAAAGSVATYGDSAGIYGGISGTYGGSDATYGGNADICGDAVWADFEKHPTAIKVGLAWTDADRQTDRHRDMHADIPRDIPRDSTISPIGRREKGRSSRPAVVHWPHVQGSSTLDPRP
eukprot:3940875-Rhodomonas_salina.2